MAYVLHVETDIEGNRGGVSKYEDNGCSIAPRCLNCPLPKCRYEDIGMEESERKLLQTRQMIRRALAEWPGRSKPAIARELGLSPRTIYRHLQADREESVVEATVDDGRLPPERFCEMPSPIYRLAKPPVFLAG